MLTLRQAKNIRDRALEMVRRDSTEPADKTAKRPKYCKEKSSRPSDKSGAAQEPW